MKSNICVAEVLKKQHHYKLMSNGNIFYRNKDGKWEQNSSTRRGRDDWLKQMEKEGFMVIWVGKTPMTNGSAITKKELKKKLKREKKEEKYEKPTRNFNERKR